MDDDLRQRGWRLIEEGRPGEARPLLEEALAAGDDEALVPLGNALWDLGDVVAAEERYRAAAALGQLGGVHNLGLLLHEQDRLEEAVALLRAGHAAGETEPEALGEALADLGGALQDADRLAEAEEVLREAADLGMAAAELRLGNLLSESDPASTEAEAFYRRAIEHGEPAGHNNLGVLLWDAGRLDEAEAELERAIAVGDTIAGQNLESLRTERRGSNGHG